MFQTGCMLDMYCNTCTYLIGCPVPWRFDDGSGTHVHVLSDDVHQQTHVRNIILCYYMVST